MLFMLCRIPLQHVFVSVNSYMINVLGKTKEKVKYFFIFGARLLELHYWSYTIGASLLELVC